MEAGVARLPFLLSQFGPLEIVQGVYNQTIHRIVLIMFEQEQKLIEEKVKAYCAANEIALAELKWQPIPFSGEWGMATSFFQTAANEARLGKGMKIPVPQRAQEIADQIKAILRLAAQDGSLPGISDIEAVKGYLNLYFTTAEYARRVVDEVLV